MLRLCIAVVGLCMFASDAAIAQTESAPPQVLAGVYACANLAGEAERLACYDEAVGRLQQAESQGRIVAVDRDQVATIERDSFGFRLPSIASILRRGQPEQDQIERVETQVVRVVTYINGRHSFVMANGQTWTQIEAQSASNVDEGDTIVIRRAALGSYMLSPQHGRAHRVRRAE